VGSFYGNVTLLGTDIAAAGNAVPRPAFLLAEGDDVVVFAELDDEGAPESGQQLSAALNCLAFSAGVHDDDIFFFEVHSRGEKVLQGAIPDPAEYFGDEMMAELSAAMPELSAMDTPATGAAVDPAALVDVLGRGDVGALQQALESDFVFATERHRAIVSALGLPSDAVGWGYRYLEEDESGRPPVTKV
jgi:hypothetical protein